MKKIIIIFTLVLSLFCIVSCTTTQNDELAPNILVENNTISWEEVDGAAKYYVYVENELYYTTKSNSITFYNLDEGTYKVYVESVFESPSGTTTHKSKTLNLTIQSNSITSLDKPVIKVNGNLITWNKISNANNYKVYVNGKEHTSITNMSFNYTILGDGTFEIYVVAQCYVGDNLITSTSNTVTVTNEISSTKQVNIFMINDTHGAFHTEDVPGLAKVSTAINSLERLNGEYIKIVNGDALQGTYVSSTLRGKPIIDALNTMEFDAFVIGNHEFDWGLDEIKKFKDGDLSNGEANFPFLGANIYDKATNQRVSWIDPYTIVENNGVKVGVIGLIGHTQESSILASMVEDYEFVYPYDIVESLSKELRTVHGCESVIVSLHDYDEDLHSRFSKLPVESSIDAILCGHEHRNEMEVLTNQSGREIPIVENRDKNQTASSVILLYDESLNKDYEFKRIYPSDYSEDAEVLKVVEKYKEIIEKSNSVVTTSKTSLNRNSIGTIAANAMIEKFDADIAIINSGGVRADIAAGEITVGDIFEALPFENEIIVVTLKGKDIIAGCDGSSFIYNSGFNLGNINYNQEYTVAIIDYVYYSYYNAEFRNDTAVDTNIILRELTIEYMANM